MSRLTFGSELEHGPSAPAEADGTNLLETVFLLQRFDVGFDLGNSRLLRMASKEPWKEYRHVYFAFLVIL